MLVCARPLPLVPSPVLGPRRAGHSTSSDLNTAPSSLEPELSFQCVRRPFPNNSWPLTVRHSRSRALYGCASEHHFVQKLVGQVHSSESGSVALKSMCVLSKAQVHLTRCLNAGLDPDISVSQFQDMLVAHSGVVVEDQEILIGYPPKLLDVSVCTLSVQ